jgi:glyoxylase-like metal-dependent hydrolase (beta-lactamase superfamily II)
MSIHFLNCGTMRPYFPRVENGITCLLIETNLGLVLVDTGLGIQDYLHPTKGMKFFLKMVRSPRDVRETAIHQIQRLGYKPEDLHHIIQTHLHIDHAGGLRDFPHAKVHVHKSEYERIKSRPGWEYRSERWTHNPDWKLHESTGEKWYDFDAMQMNGVEPEI